MSQPSLVPVVRLIMTWCAGSTALLAQLPTARLDGLAPRGGQAGREIEITLQGSDLDDVRSLIFSHAGLTATPVEGARFKIAIAADVPCGRHDVRAAGRYGLSTAAVMVVGALSETGEPGSNHAPAAAAPLVLPVTVNGTAEADTTDYFKFTAVKGRPVHLDCAAQRIDSPLNATISVRDPRGVEISRTSRTLDRDPATTLVPAMDGEHVIEVHDATWRGGAGFVYRLTVSEDAIETGLPAPVPLAGAIAEPSTSPAADETEPNDSGATAQSLPLPGEITGTLDRDWFTFTAESTRPLVIEVASHRLGVPSDPVVVVSKVSRDPNGAEQLAAVAEWDDTPGPPGCERFRLGTRDPVGRLVPEAGVTYRVFVTDRFNTGGRYRLVAREPRPDFQVLVLPESPATDTKALMRWTPLLRRHGSTVLQVAVVRQDGFDEPVTVTAENLPAGVSMAECRIPSGCSAGLVVLHASGDAPAGNGRLSLTGRAGAATRPAREVSPRWSVGDAGSDRVDLRLCADGPMLAVTEAESVPLQVEAEGASVFETSLGATLEIPVKFLRAASHKGFKGEWEAALRGLPGQKAWQPAKPAADAADAKLALALTRKDGNQYHPGTWTVYAATRGTVQWQPDEKIPVRELRDAAYSAPIQVKIDPSPVLLSGPEVLTVARGGTASIAVTLDRRFGFGEAVELTLRVPDGVKGLVVPAVGAPKAAAEASLTVQATAEAPPGRHPCVLEAKCQWNGEELISRRSLTVEITP